MYSVKGGFRMPHDALILASSSPRRQELLTSMGIPFEVHPADVDEDVNGHPQEVVLLLAQRKAQALRPQFPHRYILAADTLVSLDGRIFGKPKDELDAMRMIQALQGKWHEVHSGVCLIAPGEEEADARHAMTKVHFAPLTQDEVDAYVASGEPFGKAGAYAIQGRAGMFITEIIGSFSNVIGLPTALVRQMLISHRYPFQKEQVV